MTTIAFDGTHLCADTLITAGSERVGYQSKIYAFSSGYVAYCGDVTACHVVLDWIRKGARKNARPVLELESSFELLWIKKGKVFVVDEELFPRPGFTPYTLGSGAAYALAALHLGCTARQAVELAIKLDTGSGGDIDEVCVKEVKKCSAKKR